MRINRRFALLGSAAALTAAATRRASAQSVGPDALKSTLTPLGGLRAGNAEGTIPAWTGEIIPLPADYQPGTPRPDPFAGEKPVFSITAANLATYQNKLAKGNIYLLQTYPDYLMDVYPTHRTSVAPQYVYDYTDSGERQTGDLEPHLALDRDHNGGFRGHVSGHVGR
jgi:hypothetical protein